MQFFTSYVKDVDKNIGVQKIRRQYSSKQIMIKFKSLMWLLWQ